MKLRTDDPNLSGKEFRTAVGFDLDELVQTKDPLKVLKVCVDQECSGDGKSDPCLRTANVLFECYLWNHHYCSAEHVAQMAKDAIEPIKTAAQKAEEYAMATVKYTEVLRPILRYDDRYIPSIYICRSEAWTRARRAKLAAITITALFDEVARAELAKEAAGLVSSPSPTRAHALLKALRTA